MVESKRKVLITGCSNGSLGAALAVTFHKAGLHVYATARNTAKASNLTTLGIEVLQLDVLSDASIAACAAQIPALDMLINNAGAGYTMPVADLDINEGKRLFDLNVWSYIAVTQAFLPVLLKAPNGGVIANHTSAAGLMSVPCKAAYCASKAAIAIFSDSLRMELEVFNVKVVDLKTSLVKSNILTAPGHELPKESIYGPARELMTSILQEEPFQGSDQQGQDQAEWAQDVVKELLRDDLPLVIYSGENADMTKHLPAKPGQMDAMVKSITGFEKVEEALVKNRK